VRVRELRLRDQVLTLERPVIMGILNVTPDSFSEGGALPSPEAVVARARALVAGGAAILDIGGESTRPGAEPVDAAVELSRVMPALQALCAARIPALVSVDTQKAQVAEAALAAGAHLVNDVSALRDPAMVGVVARSGAGLVVMHMRGDPRTMQAGDIAYDDVVREVREFLGRAVERAVAGGIEHGRILVDPGLGFGKTTAHNIELTRRLGELRALGQPIVYGPSRKRFLGELTGREVGDRDRATAAACAIAVANGASVVRVHDAEAVRDAIRVAQAFAPPY
jgi:dihydropteroate synthase